MKIAIIDYGAGNVQSVQFSLARLGYESCISKDAVTIKAADRVIFPGVGEAGSAMAKTKRVRFECIDSQLRTTGFRHLFRNATDV